MALHGNVITAEALNKLVRINHHCYYIIAPPGYIPGIGRGASGFTTRYYFNYFYVH